MSSIGVNSGRNRGFWQIYMYWLLVVINPISFPVLGAMLITLLSGN